MHHEVCGFEHLHLHSDKSLLDGFGKVEEYAKKWKGHGDYLCISDHGMMAAIPSQIRNCKATGDKDDTHKEKSLTPIFSCELYVNPLQIQYHSDKEFKDYQKTLDPDQLKSLRRSYHLLAIAHNNIGYSNLVTLSSLAWLHGYYYRPRVNHELLLQYKEGITFSSCCYAGEIGQAFDKGGEDAGFAMIEKYMAMFGEHFYLEIMLLDFIKQKPYNQFILKAKEKYHLPIYVTNDCHFCEQEDSYNQHLMLMVQTRTTIQSVQKKAEETGSEDLFQLQDKNLWQKTEAEINEKWERDFSDTIDYEIFKEAKRTTVEVCRKARGVQLDRTMKLPQIPDANDKLREAVFAGFKSRDLPRTKAYSNRLREEFELVFEKGFSSYFLILKSTVDEARRYSMEMFGHPNVIGPGRGSCVGSLICYCLRATNVDPIQHDLLFSRFLSKARNDLPDADVDFLKSARDYLKTDWAPKYFGIDNVANIGSYNTFGIKGSLIDMVRVHDKDRNEILNLTTKLGLKDDDGDILTWDKALEIYPELKKYCEENQEPTQAAKKLIGRSRSMGKHAGGIIISSVPINKFIPLVRGKEGEIVTSWTEGLHDQDLGPMGFVKYDWLVITNLEQINYACKIIKERHGLKGICNKPDQEDWSDSSFINDPLSIAMANQADLKGIFQFDSDGIRNLVRKGGVNTFNDLVAYASLYRPGPMSEGMHDEYCARKKGTKEYVIHPLLKPVLEKTHGVICVHGDSMISLANGIEVPLKLVKKGSLIHSVNEDTKKIEFNLCHGSSPTRVCDGLRITLNNGYSVIVTPDHKLMTYEGMKEARALDPKTDLVMVPKKLPQSKKTRTNVRWLGKGVDVAYLLGQLIGDGCVSSTNTDICSGTKENHDKLFRWLNNTFESLKFREYYHCRSWYIAVSGRELMNDAVNYGNRKTRFNVFLEQMGIRGKNCYTKFIPDSIMTAPANIRRAFIAGMLDSDGCIGVDDSNGLCHCNLTSVSEKVRNSFRKLLLLDGVSNSLDDVKVYVSNIKRLNKLVSKYLVIKNISGKLTNGRSQYFIPRKLLIDKKNISGLSIRQWSKDNNIDRQHFKKERLKFISDKFSKFLEVETKEVGFIRIKKIEKVKNQQFYGLAVENNHNFIANGIVVSNCYQEQCMKILHIVGDIPLEDCEILRKAISKKKEEYFAKYKVMFIQNGMKNLGWTEEEVINLWKQLEAFAGYAFNLSHSCAYTYISCMLLWLKSHYPLEFYTAILHFESDADKIKDYRLDAQRHDIVVNPLNLNKSKSKFDIVDDQIYFGFANVKGIGEAISQRIIDNQPYNGLHDFLARFGTDESVVKPLIGLKIFSTNATPVEVYQYYKWAKDIKEKRVARRTRFEASCEKDLETAKALGFELTEHQDILKIVADNQEVQKLVTKHDRLISNYTKKETIDVELPDLGAYRLRLTQPPLMEPVEVPEKIKELLSSSEACETEFYGFLWNHPICKSPDYEGRRTFDDFKEKGLQSGYVELMINAVAKQVSKKNTNYWLVKAEDANGENAQIQVWEDDWLRFKDDLKAGQFVKMEVKAPDKGFYRYTLYSPPKWMRHKLVPKTREADMRVWVLRKQELSD